MRLALTKTIFLGTIPCYTFSIVMTDQHERLPRKIEVLHQEEGSLPASALIPDADPVEVKAELQTERRQLFEALRLIFASEDTFKQGMELLEQTQITIKDSHFRVIDFIGQGGFGFVVEAELVGNPEIKVALKLSAPVNLSDQFLKPAETDADQRGRTERVRAAIREVEALKRISAFGERSPYPEYYDAQFVRNPDLASETVLLLSMEKINGENLEQLIADGLYEDPEVLFNISKQLAEAVALTHRAGFVHRDIKPGNVLIDQDDRIRLVDLGLAVRTDRADSTKATYRQPVPDLLGGTGGYMHNNEDDQLSPAHDVYALGRSFQQLLVGDAFRRAMDLNVAMRRLRDPILKQFVDLTYQMVKTDSATRPKMLEVLAKLDELQSQLEQKQVKEQMTKSA